MLKKHGLLKNNLGIAEQRELDQVESQALINTYDNAATDYSEIHSFTVDDICYLHRLFLGEIYEWAGNYRDVDISSEEIRWCHARFIKSEMGKYNGLLEKLTPFSVALSREDVIKKLARLHGELIIIHPFRDGNGRLTRLLCDLLLMQAELGVMAKAPSEDEKYRQDYYFAIRKVWANGDYQPLERLLNLSIPTK